MKKLRDALLTNYARVETYIVPEADKLAVQAAIKEIDHLKIANQLQVKNEHISENNIQSEEDASSVSHNKYMEFARYSVENNTLIDTKTITNKAKDKILLNKQFDNDNYVKYYKDKDFYHSDLNVQKMEFQTSIGLQNDKLYPVKQFKRINSLMSIDEKSEDSSETKLSDCCRHGYKNGCTATIPSPEEVSEEVFKKNWLQKIEILRQREAKLREKEMNLQNREKELFKREKELRIAERTLNDKLRQLDEQLKYQRDMQIMDKKLEKMTRILSESFKEPDEPVKTERFSNSQPLIYQKCEKSEESDKKMKSSMHSKSNLLSRQSSSTNITNKFHSYASIRYKERPKINYDDLNSTLSADVGDSSFMRTSEKFNPEIYKKPYAFTRSASERWPKQKDSTAIAKLQGVIDAEEKHKHVVEENKVLRKLSENIYASQKKDTKFQNYGLVDYKPDDIQSKMKHNPGSEERLSLYLDVETGDKNSDRRSDRVFKDRPLSWNVETNEWLQKKRQAYNLATKQSAENKENLKCNTVMEKDGKASKKIVRNKILTIFR